MKLNKLVPLFTVKSIAPLEAFYVAHFGLSVTMRTDGYLHMSGGDGAEVAFMSEDAEAPRACSGEGVTLCLEVADVDAEAARLLQAGLPIVTPLQDNPWGDRSIIVRDPVGIHVYVYQLK